MEFKVQSMDLSLIRDIIEGVYDDVIQNDHQEVLIINDSMKRLSSTDVVPVTKKHRSKKKLNKDIKKKRNLKFYLEGSNLAIRDWLRDKKIEKDKQKDEQIKQKKEERLKIVKDNEEILKRETIAREAYDQWLKDLRKRCTNNSIHLKCKKEIKNTSSTNLEAFHITRKKKESNKSKIHNVHILPESKTSLKIQPVDYNTALLSYKINEKPRKNILNSKYKSFYGTDTTRVKETKHNNTSNENNDDMNDIIKNLRRNKTKEKERSKTRVDSGIFFKREKINKEEIKPDSESFKWRFIDNEEKVFDKKNTSRGIDSRSRHVDRITHEHVNPFEEKSLQQIKIN